MGDGYHAKVALEQGPELKLGLGQGEGLLAPFGKRWEEGYKSWPRIDGLMDGIQKADTEPCFSTQSGDKPRAVRVT